MADDFPRYAEARWPALVTFLVDEGVEPETAREQATAGLARCRPRWRGMRDDHDVDEQVLALVTGRDDREQADRFLASLAVERDPADLPHRDPPVADILARARAARRRTAQRWGLALLALGIVAGGVWLVMRPDRPPPGVHEAHNPLPVPWYFDGELHLDGVVVDRPQLTGLVQVVGGVVYRDAEGRIAFVDEEGEVTVIGRTGRGQPMAVDQDGDRVVWTDTTGESARLVTYDVPAGQVTDSLPLTQPSAAPIAVDRGQVFYRDGDEAFAWTPGETGDDGQATAPVVRTLLDSAEGASVNQAQPGALQVIRSYTPVLSLPGNGADLSPDGRWLLTYRPGSFFQPLAYNAVDGARLDLGLPESQYALAYGFGPDGSFLFAVRHDANQRTGDQDSVRLSESGPILLVQCRPGMNTPCETLTQLAGDTAYPPVLAG